jgi:hypothetical protein
MDIFFGFDNAPEPGVRDRRTILMDKLYIPGLQYSIGFYMTNTIFTKEIFNNERN